MLRKKVLGVLVVILLMCGTGVILGPEVIVQRLSAFTQPQTEESFQDRLSVWRDSLQIVSDFPVTGTGLGTFSHLFRRYQRFPSNLLFTHTENDYLQLLTETGLPGTLLMLGAGSLFFIPLLKAWKQQRSRWNNYWPSMGF